MTGKVGRTNLRQEALQATISQGGAIGVFPREPLFRIVTLRGEVTAERIASRRCAPTSDHDQRNA
jgi:hypothetical protein